MLLTRSPTAMAPTNEDYCKLWRISILTNRAFSPLSSVASSAKICTGARDCLHVRHYSQWDKAYHFSKELLLCISENELFEVTSRFFRDLTSGFGLHRSRQNLCLAKAKPARHQLVETDATKAESKRLLLP